MSYFYPSSSLNLDNDNEKSEKKKQQSRHNLSRKDELEPISRCHRRKHSSRARCMSKTKIISCNTEDNNDCRTPSPKNKHKRSKPTGKHCDSDVALAKAFSTPESGFMEELCEKDSLLQKYKNKCIKLTKHLQETQTENDALKIQLQESDSRFKEMHLHYEELLKKAQLLEEDRNSIINEYKKFASENTQLTEDVRLLKVLVYRMNVELERYQDKIRSCPELDVYSNLRNTNDSVDTAVEQEKIAAAWSKVNFHALGPLLEAYQESLVEKDELIQQFRREMDHFTGRCKEIVAENENLQIELQNYKLQSDKFNTEIKTIDDDAALIKAENDNLTLEVSALKQKLQEIHSVYEKKVESMSQDNNKLHENYVACQAELSNLQGKYEILNDGYEKLKKNSDKTMPISVHTDAIDECKRLFEELKTQYQSEKKKLVLKLNELEKSNPENEKLVATLTVERDHLRHSVKSLEKNFKRSQNKLESIQAALHSIQVSKDSFRRQLAKMSVYCEELVTEQEKLVKERNDLVTLVRQREKENESIQYLGNNISQRMGTLKNQLKSVQDGAKEQLAAIEKHIKIQEISMDKMKSEYHRELERLKQLVKQKEEVIGKLQRDKLSTQDNLELVWRAATNEDKIVRDTLKKSKLLYI